MSYGLKRAVSEYEGKHRDFREKPLPIVVTKCAYCGNDMPIGGLCKSPTCEFYLCVQPEFR